MSEEETEVTAAAQQTGDPRLSAFVVATPLVATRHTSGGGGGGVRNGPGQEPFRASQREECRLLFVRHRGQLYLVTPGMAGSFGSNVRSGRAIKAVAATGRPVLITVLDTPDSWSRSATQGVELSYTRWVVLEPQRATCTFVARIVEVDLPEPDWLTLPTLDEMILSVYGHRLIDSPEHPLLALRN